MTSRIKTGVILFLLLAAGCLEPYNLPRQNTDELGYLVVDGYLDGNTGSASINLSRSTNLFDYKSNPGEPDADVQLEVENGPTIKLTEGNNGLYSANNLNFDPKANYKVRVSTKYGSNYASDYIQLKPSPSFDSLVWRAEDKGIQFYANAHDDSGNTKYYLYRYTETWFYQSTFVSHYKSANALPVRRGDKELVHDCWTTQNSADVIIESTTNLEKDVVSMFPVFLIPKGSRKLIDTYSVIVEQRALSEDEYAYWDLIRKTNQSLGGLFDPIPSQVLGNVRCEDKPTEPVLGHFSGGFSKKIRIFIRYKQLPPGNRGIDPLSFGCGVSDYIVGNANNQDPLGTRVFLDLHIAPNTWYVTSAECGDCRALGGDTLRPKFWPQ